MKEYLTPRKYKTGILLLFILSFNLAPLFAQTVQVFTTSGTFTVPACVTSITVMCWGAGGGGGGAAEPGGGAAGSGGGGGGFAMSTLTNVSGTFTVTVGTGGTPGIGAYSTAGNGGAGGNSIVTNGTVTVTGVGGGGGTGNTSGPGGTVGAGGGGTFVGCTGTTFTGGNGALGNTQHNNTGGGGGGGAGNAGNGVTPAQTQQDANGNGGVGGAGNPNTAQYAGGVGGSVSAAFYEDGGSGATIGGGGAGGGGEDQFFNGTGPGNGGQGGNGQVIISYSLSTPAITSVTGSGCPGSTVTINGSLLTGATSVTIGGTAVTGLTITATQITGTIAPGTATGTVSVTTPCGTATSAAPFTVHPANVVNLGSHTFCTSYTFGGTTYTTGGNYTNTVPSTVTGCDSVTNITLVAGTVITQSISQNICAGSSYHFGNNNLTTSGTYKDTVLSVTTGCDSITTLTLTVIPVIQKNLVQSICSGSSYSFGGRTLTTQGTYLDTATSAVTGCDSVTTLNLTVVQTPAGTITPASLTVCPGVNTTLNASPAASYVWSDGSTTQSITVSPNTTTTYSLAESNSGCTASGTSLLTVTPFTITISPDSSRSCAAQLVTLTCSYTSPNTTGYTWSSVPAATSPGNSQGVTVFPLVTTTYSVTVSNGNCTASATAEVMVNAVPVSITPATAGVCLGHDTTLTASGGQTYQWSNGTAGATNTVTPTVATKYIVTATDAQGCTASDSITVAVGTPPTATFTVSSPLCAGKNGTVTYTGTSTPAAVYTWNFGGGTVAAGTGKGPYQVSWNAGPQSISLAVSDNGCVAIPDTLVVNVDTLPVAYAGADTAYCGSNSIVIGTAAIAGYTYLWSPANGLSSATVSNPTVSLTNTTTSPVLQTYTVTVNSNGCTSSDSVVLTIEPGPVAFFTHPAGQCLDNNQFSFAAGSSFLPSATFAWDFGANATPPTSTSQNQSVTYSTAQTTAVSLTISQVGCVSNVYIDSVTVYPMPVAAFSADTTTGCPGLDVCFLNTSTSSGNTSYLWNFGDGQTSTLQTPCHAYPSAGSYSVTLSVSANGCANTLTDSNFVKINVAPKAAFTASASVIQLPQSEIDFTNLSSNAVTYLWNFGGLGGSTDINPVFNFNEYGLYNVVLHAYNAFGCSDSAVVPVKVLASQSYFIPNVFTPNNDGNNDKFYIEMQEGVTVLEFTVFNRLGEKVHDSLTPWDGTYQGKPSPEGVYVYICKLQLAANTEGIKRVGTVTLIR